MNEQNSTFILRYGRKPSSHRLDPAQRKLALNDLAYRQELKRKLAKNPARWLAFIAGTSTYLNPDKPCPRCLGVRRRVRDQSCHACQLRRSAAGWAAIRKGERPSASRSWAGHLDKLARTRREKAGESATRTFGSIVATLWPTGRLELLVGSDRCHDLASQSPQTVRGLMLEFPEEMAALMAWAGWQ
jgi:hypothetical protein